MASPAPPPASCFWCHSCHRIVRLLSSSTLVCPLCSGGFVELINGVSLHPTAAFFVSAELSPHSHISREDALLLRRSPFLQAREMLSMWRSQARPSGAVDVQEDGQHSGHFNSRDPMFSRRGSRSEALTGSGIEGFELWLGLGSHHRDPAPSFFDRLQRVLSRRRGASGNRLGFGFGPHHHGTGSRRFVDMQDFLLGPGGDLLIGQLIEGAEMGRNGSTPASEAAVDAMPTLIISKPSLDADDVYCAVCKEVFDVGGEAREMPCKHMYHNNCILPWLALNNSCPICRHEIPTEVLVDNQAGRVEGVESIQREGNSGTSGERGLAIVGIPGIGILVRSFLLSGNGVLNETNVGNEVPNVYAAMETSNVSSNGSSRQSESAYNDVSGTLSSRNSERHASGSETVGDLRQSRSVNVGNSHMHCIISSEGSDINSGLASQVTNSGRSRNFLSWLSYRMRSTNTVNREASGSGSRRPPVWF